MIYSVTEAKNRLPELIKKAEAGEAVTITKRGIAAVELVRKQDSPKKKRIFGGLDSEIAIHDPNWARPQNDIEAWLKGDV